MPSASTFAIRAGTSSLAKEPVTASENLLRTSYGDSRPRCTTRVASCSSRSCTGSNDSATIAVASTDSPRCGDEVWPISAPPPSTTTT